MNRLNLIGIVPQTIVKSATVLVVVLLISAGSAVAEGTSGLIGVIPGFPQLDATGAVGQGCSYDAGTQTLTVTTTPTLYFPDANTLNFVNSGLLTLTATIDSLGSVTAGSLVVNGTTSGGLGDPLLVGSTSATYGLEDTSVTPGATDRSDFVFTVTGGSILSDPNWPVGFDVGLTLTMEGSTYGGSLASDWTCSRAKVIVGPVEATGEPPNEGACSQGFWKNHSAEWVVNSLTLGSINYTQEELIVILKSKPKGDKSIILAKQLIAAKLNVAANSDPTCISSVIDAADAWLDTYAPGGLPGDVYTWGTSGENIKEDLDMYNNGEMCAGSCTR